MEYSPQKIDESAGSQAVINNSEDNNNSMEVENNHEVIKVGKQEQHLVKLMFDDELTEVEIKTKTIKKIIFEKLQSNYINNYANTQTRSFFVTFATAEEAIAFANFDFKSVEMNCSTKILTHNEELDKRKVKLWKPSTSAIKGNDVKAYLERYGEMEEFYEVRTTESRKRTFVVAFKEMEAKLRLLKRSSIFIGKDLIKIDDFLIGSNTTAIKSERFTIRISNIPATTTEYLIAGLMDKMKSNFWHIPVAKNGIRMRCVIASFDHQEKYEAALKVPWEYEGRNLILTDASIKCCFMCGNMEHSVKTCPKKAAIKHKNNNEKIKLYQGNNWQEVSQSIIQKNSNNKGDDNKETKDSLLETIIKEYEETKNRISRLEEENKQLKEALANMRVEVNEKIENSSAENRQQFKVHDGKIDHLCGVVAGISQGIDSILDRLDIESGISKIKKTKTTKSHENSY